MPEKNERDRFIDNNKNIEMNRDMSSKDISKYIKLTPEIKKN